MSYYKGIFSYKIHLAVSLVDGKLSSTIYGNERTFHRRNELYFFSYKR